MNRYRTLMVIAVMVRMSPTSSVYWTFSNKPVIYGGNIILTCETNKTLESAPHCPVRQWFGGPENKLLLYNEFSANASKYVDKTDLKSSKFSLVIKSWKESDINLNYTCSCGFTSYTKQLLLTEENFIVLPKSKHVKIQENNGTLSVELYMERSYPKPDCYLTTGTKQKRKLMLKSKGNRLFDDYEYHQDFNLTGHDCFTPQLVCQISNITVIEETGDNLGICTEIANDEEITDETTEMVRARSGRKDIWIGVSLGTVTVIIIAVVVYIVHKKGRIKYQKVFRRIQHQKVFRRYIDKNYDSTLSDNRPTSIV